MSRKILSAQCGARANAPNKHKMDEDDNDSVVLIETPLIDLTKDEEDNQRKIEVERQKKKGKDSTEGNTTDMLIGKDKRLFIAKSKIHGLGAFSSHLIKKNQIIGEYSGELISLKLADERQKWYIRNGISTIYLFKLDEKTIIDATRHSNDSVIKRVNHSCKPNCYSKVVQSKKKKKIVILAKRDIRPVGGRPVELTMDYFFEISGKKEIPCFCKSKNCRKFLDA